MRGPLVALLPRAGIPVRMYGRVTFFGASTGALCQKLEWTGSLVSMVLSPDGDVVACGSQDNSVHFWRRSTEEDSMMSGYRAKPSALAFDETGTLLATGGGEAVTIWSFRGSGPEGTRPGVLEHHVQTVTTLAFARRGMRLASGARDRGVVVWSVGRDGQGHAIARCTESPPVRTVRGWGRLFVATDTPFPERCERGRRADGIRAASPAASCGQAGRPAVRARGVPRSSFPTLRQVPSVAEMSFVTTTLGFGRGRAVGRYGGSVVSSP